MNIKTKVVAVLMKCLMKKNPFYLCPIVYIDFTKSTIAPENDHDCAPCAAYRIGCSHQLAGDTDKAIEWFEKAVSIAGKGSTVWAFSGRSMRSAQGERVQGRCFRSIK